jgi:hypothetical protein
MSGYVSIFRSSGKKDTRSDEDLIIFYDTSRIAILERRGIHATGMGKTVISLCPKLKNSYKAVRL